VSQVARISYLGCDITGKDFSIISNKVRNSVRIRFNFIAKIRSNHLNRYFCNNKTIK
jgi:hypothetical protein